MCLVTLAVAPSPGVALLLTANRDELHARPTDPAAPWPDAPEVFAGRDRRAGGTWLGVTCAGRFAALTNVRDPAARREGLSRGLLVASVLTARESLDDVAARALEEAPRYPAFNLLVGEGSRVLYVRDDGAAPQELTPGPHALSNARLDDPWPKTIRALGALDRALTSPAPFAPAFEALADTTIAADAELPRTGVPLEIERALSPAFIVGPTYGTRCSTVLLVGTDGSIEIEERSFGPNGTPGGVVRRRLPRAPRE